MSAMELAGLDWTNTFRSLSDFPGANASDTEIEVSDGGVDCARDSARVEEPKRTASRHACFWHSFSLSSGLYCAFAERCSTVVNACSTSTPRGFATAIAAIGRHGADESYGACSRDFRPVSDFSHRVPPRPVTPRFSPPSRPHHPLCLPFYFA